MFRKFLTPSFRKFDPKPLRYVSVQRTVPERSTSQAVSEQPTEYTLLLNSVSKRRIENSPTLSLEAVALPTPVKEEIQKYITRQKISAKQIRKSASPINLVRAPESLSKKTAPTLGRPIVQPPPIYDPHRTAAFAAIRMPGTFAANVFVMAEAARLSPGFAPNSILDFGSGPGTSLIAASRVFSQSQADPTMEEMRDQRTIRKASLVDTSAHMRSLATDIIGVDPWISSNTTISQLSDLRECQPQETFDVVSCSYALNEVVRGAISSPSTDNLTTDQNQSVNRANRLQLAEKQLRRTTKALWSKTAPNGLFIVIEDGTAAGFETVAFVRNIILKASPPLPVLVDEGSPEHTENEEPRIDSLTAVTQPVTRANVIAPCLHTRSCPLNGSITRHRICRFQQRLNRPPYSRSALPMATGYEDEYFSFLVVQKLVVEEQQSQINGSTKNARWGRLIRRPLQKGKHVTLDACTNEAKLERRVISKKRSSDGMYSRARQARWGDVWPKEPSASAQTLNF